MKNFSFRNALIFTSLLSLILGFSGAYLMLQNPFTPAAQVVSDETAVEHAIKHLDPNYICPMHHEITSANEGSCPICGMDLVEIESHESVTASDSDGQPVVSLSPQVVNNLSVRKATVEHKNMTRSLDVSGYVEQVEINDQNQIRAPFDGVIKELIDVSRSAKVDKDMRLFTLRSERVIAIQEKHLGAFKEGDQKTLSITRLQLSRLGLSQQQVKELEESGTIQETIEVRAPHAGTITNLSIQTGARVKAYSNVMDLADNANIWVLASVFDSDSSWVRPGTKAELSVRHVPGQTWTGYVTEDSASSHMAGMSSKGNSVSEKNSARFIFSLPVNIVRKGSPVTVHMRTKTRKNTMVIPTESLIYGESDVRVVKALGEGRFQPVSVKTGIESDGYTEIVSGLSAGDIIVATSQFLIDSESQLIASFRRMQGK